MVHTILIEADKNMKCKHYYRFDDAEYKKLGGEKLDKDGWNTLRLSLDSGSFALEKEKELYEENCLKEVSYENMAKAIAKQLKEYGVKRACSLGVGKGILEWHLKRIDPNLCVECTDYTVETLDILRKVFPSADKYYQFDMMQDSYGKLSIGTEDVLVVSRLSAEFSKTEWKKIFQRMAEENVKQVLFVPIGIDNAASMVSELLRHYANLVLRKKDTMCGWLYSENEFLAFWRDYYSVKNTLQFDNTKGYFLTKK